MMDYHISKSRSALTALTALTGSDGGPVRPVRGRQRSTRPQIRQSRKREVRHRLRALNQLSGRRLQLKYFTEHAVREHCE